MDPQKAFRTNKRHAKESVFALLDVCHLKNCLANNYASQDCSMGKMHVAFENGAQLSVFGRTA